MSLRPHPWGVGSEQCNGNPLTVRNNLYDVPQHFVVVSEGPWPVLGKLRLRSSTNSMDCYAVGRLLGRGAFGKAGFVKVATRAMIFFIRISMRVSCRGRKHLFRISTYSPGNRSHAGD